MSLFLLFQIQNKSPADSSGTLTSWWPVQGRACSVVYTVPGRKLSDTAIYQSVWRGPSESTGPLQPSLKRSPTDALICCLKTAHLWTALSLTALDPIVLGPFDAMLTSSHHLSLMVLKFFFAINIQYFVLLLSMYFCWYDEVVACGSITRQFKTVWRRYSPVNNKILYWIQLSAKLIVWSIAFHTCKKI